MLGKHKIPKYLLDEAIAFTRDYYNFSASPQTLSHITDKTMLIEAVTGIWWLNIESILSAILSCHGLKPDATNEDIYAILRLLGWEVSD